MCNQDCTWSHFVQSWSHEETDLLDCRARASLGVQIDFVLAGRSQRPTAIECKWSAGGFHSKNLRAFRRQYPDGQNWVVATDVEISYERVLDELKVEFLSLADVAERIGLR